MPKYPRLEVFKIVDDRTKYLKFVKNQYFYSVHKTEVTEYIRKFDEMQEICQIPVLLFRFEEENNYAFVTKRFLMTLKEFTVNLRKANKLSNLIIAKLVRKVAQE